MNRTVASKVLADALLPWSKKSHTELTSLVGKRFHDTLRGIDGPPVQVEIEVLWDADAGGTIRVLAEVDAGGIRALFPWTDSVLVKP